MGTASLNGFLQRLRKAMAAETLAAFPDSELIDRFLADHEEAAFQALLHRHGPMVLRVCRRTLSGEHDVEDAFQATFLALASKARTLRKRESLASWLQCNAYHIALDACKSRKRRRKHETVAAIPDRTPALADDVVWKELRSVLDRELASLPERLSAPLVLCYLEGLTQDEAAARLGQSKSTFRRNLERARELLGSRLTQRGVTLSAALFAPLLSECVASAAVPSALAASTTEAAAALAAGKAIAALASARAILLAQGAIQPILPAKVKCACVLLLGAVLIGFGGAAMTKESLPVDPPAKRHPIANQAVDPGPGAKVDKAKAAERIEFRNPLLVLHAEVQAELKLTTDQIRAIDNMMRETKETTPSGPLPPGQPADPTVRLVTAKATALRKELPDLLTDVQALRLRQLERQRAGMVAFIDHETVKFLALTEAQREKVRTIVETMRPSPSAVSDGGAGGRRPDMVGDVQPINVKTTNFDNTKATNAGVGAIMELLTDAQRKTWRDLTGEAFDFALLPVSEAFLATGGSPPGRIAPK
jgi:RNA polymerase sigma factor (sigma-70 family)